MKEFIRILIPKEMNKKKFLAEVAATMCLMLAIGFILFYMLESSEITYYRENIETSQMSVVSLQKQYVTASLESVKDDLFYIKEMKPMNDLINASEQKNIPVLKKELASELSKLIKVNPSYDQLRYIDNTGMEIIRINQRDHITLIVSEDELQNKSDRYYFTDAMTLDESEVYQSVMDLNVENGIIEEPYKPMIRFGVKVYDQQRREIGIVLINYNASNLIDAFNRITVNSDGNSYLIDANGYILAGHDSYNFAFMFGDDISKSYMGEYNSEWQRINYEHLIDRTVQFYDDHDLHTVAEVVLQQGISHESHWYIASNISREASPYASNRSVLYLVIMDYLNFWYLLIPIFFVGWVIIALFTYRRMHIESITEMAQIDFMTGTFNRNAGIEVVQSNLEYALKNDLDYSLCFIDLNDLKKVNDEFGHELGDEYLITTVSIIKSCFRDSDQLIRMGGDEFLIGLQGSTAVIEKNWQKVVAKVEEFNLSEIASYTVALSHGVSSAQEENISDVEELIVCADQRMYVEKRKMKGK